MTPAPTAYYSEIDPFCCAWLSNLMDAGRITPGRIDDRDVQEVTADDVRGYDRVHLFAGIAGWEFALALAGWTGPVWTGSCPCQPLSVAGKRQGPDDERHLWPAFQRLVAECRPPVVFGEQVAGRLGREWLAAVRLDLEAVGYACGAADLPAASVGAPHIRQRLFWVADSDAQHGWGGAGWEDGQEAGDGIGVGDAKGDGRGQECAEPRGGETGGGAKGQSKRPWDDCSLVPCVDGKARPIPDAQSGILPLAHGVPARMGRLRAYGNAIVPQAAAAFVMAVGQVRLL